MYENEKAAVDDRLRTAKMHPQARNMGAVADPGYPMGGEARSPGIRQRVERAVYRIEGDMRRAAAAQRAKEIIDQHPEFAELLDLLNEI